MEVMEICYLKKNSNNNNNNNNNNNAIDVIDKKWYVFSLEASLAQYV